MLFILWKDRGLYSADDLGHMNAREADKFVKKDNVWKRPDYQSIIKSGVSFEVVYVVKLVRDSLDTTPQYFRTDDTPEKRLARQRQLHGAFEYDGKQYVCDGYHVIRLNDFINLPTPPVPCTLNAINHTYTAALEVNLEYLLSSNDEQTRRKALSIYADYKAADAQFCAMGELMQALANVR